MCNTERVHSDGRKDGFLRSYFGIAIIALILSFQRGDCRCS